MSDINASKSRFPSARPWTASGSRSPFTTEEPSKPGEKEEGENKIENLREKRKRTVERSLVGGRRQRRAAARHAPTASDDHSSVEEKEVEKEIIVKSRPKKPKRFSSSHLRKYSVPRHESPETPANIKSMAEKEQNNAPKEEKTPEQKPSNGNTIKPENEEHSAVKPISKFVNVARVIFTF
uniref:Uncharacterized protein n=1 Tax=Panagrolaimus superbus TaxID=310955 RepID=A0A914XXF3_9BILA